MLIPAEHTVTLLRVHRLFLIKLDRSQKGYLIIILRFFRLSLPMVLLMTKNVAGTSSSRKIGYAQL